MVRIPASRSKRFARTALAMGVLMPMSGALGRQEPLIKQQVQVSTKYGQIVLERISLVQHNQVVSISGTIGNKTRTGWNQLVLALTFYGKPGNVLPAEQGVSTFVRIRHLGAGEKRRFSEQIPWHIIRRKFHLPQGRIADFVVTYDSDDSGPTVHHTVSSRP
jgi:hypothetical protein